MSKKRKDTVSKTNIPDFPKALNKAQGKLIDALHNKEMVITVGPAGTGKTYIPSVFAGCYYKLGKSERIIITRPTVPTGKSIGFFPGTLEEKMQPWTKPIMEVLEGTVTKGAVETMLKAGNVEIVPFETIRGRSWNDCFIILDEAQNTSKEEIKAFVTRIGENCTVVINGDISQSDLKEASGLAYLLELLKVSKSLQEKVALVTFTSDDIVRSGLCKDFVKAFEIKP